MEKLDLAGVPAHDENGDELQLWDRIVLLCTDEITTAEAKAL